MADRGATQGWLSAATRAALTEVGGTEMDPLVATQKPGITNNRQFRRIVVSVCPGSCTDIRRSLRFNLLGIPRSDFFIFQNSLYFRKYEFTNI